MPTMPMQAMGYLPVGTAGLCSSAVLDCDLFIQRPGRAVAELYRERSLPIAESDLEHLRAAGVDHLYVRLSDADAYRAYLCEHFLKREDIPVSSRMKVLRDVTRVNFQEALVANGTDQLVTVAEEFGQELATMVAEQSPAFCEVFKTLEHDYYTFTHVCNVSLFSALLAKQLGVLDRTELAGLATAALLHDIGKRGSPLYRLANHIGPAADSVLIKPDAAVSLQVMADFAYSDRSAVGTPTSHCVEDIHDRTDPRPGLNLRASNPRRIAGTIEPFMVLVDNHQLRPTEVPSVCELAETTRWMFLNEFPISFAELFGLVQYTQRNRPLADVMEQGSSS